ncbi:MAG: FlgO family outer membrane protein [Elusimicrobiota bacterium]|jgi:TolB-like protein
MRAPVILSILLLAAAQVQAAETLQKLAGRLGKALKAEPARKIAVLAFPYPDGTSNNGSTIIQERLTTFLVEGGKVEVIERNLLKKVLEEKKLEASGLLDPKTTQELGKVLGVSAVVTGTLNDLPKNRAEINARVIATETGKILAAGRADIERTWADSPAHPSGPVPPQPPKGAFLGRPLVQLAILLDTSSSMDGLINQARAQLWKIVNELARAEKSGDNPEVQVALYEYGNDGLGQGTNWIRQALPFTKDLDLVSEKLFALKTNGGQEFCGAVIRHAVENLAWDKHDDVYKAVFIAGNEPFTQGPVDFREAADEARKKGIAINTVFCGGRMQGEATQWLAGAQAGSGEFSNIDQQAQLAQVQAPQDDEMMRLNNEMNSTYIPYGAGGAGGKAKQEAQDNMAASAAPGAGVAAERVMFKASRQYAAAASSWDLASAVESGQVKESDIKTDNLPENMRGMTAAQRQDYIRKQSSERKRIQTRLQQLGEERRKYVASQSVQGSATLDAAVLSAVRGQAAKKGYSFK